MIVINDLARSLKPSETLGTKAKAEALKKEGKTASSISIASPGPLDPIKGVILDPPNLQGIRDLAIVDELKGIFNLPVFLLNDADAALLGELWSGAGKKFKDIVYLTLSSGVGSGMLKNGQLQPKTELGHEPMIIDDQKRSCSCGGSNHAEAYLGTTGLAETYAKIFEVKVEEMKPEDRYKVSFEMKKGVTNGDEKWLEVENQYSKHLTEVLKKIASIYEPEIIVIGGGIAYRNESLLKKTLGHLKELNIEVKISLAELIYNVNLGAAKYALKQLGDSK